MTATISYYKSPCEASGRLNITYELFQDHNDVMKLSEGAEVTGLSVSTLRRQIKKGALPGFRIGRTYFIAKNDLINYIESGGGL